VLPTHSKRGIIIQLAPETFQNRKMLTLRCSRLRLRIWHLGIQDEAEDLPRLALVHSFPSRLYKIKPTLLQKINLESFRKARMVWKGFKVTENTIALTYNPYPRFVYAHKNMDVACFLGLLPLENDLVANRLIIQMAMEGIKRIAISHCWFREVFLN
jgi:hypothetical protein